jgi:DNA repair protein RadC
VAITDWPLQERPRERLLALGAASLADAELLAILLRTGIKGKSAVDLARQLLGRFGSVGGLLDAGSANLAEIPGMGRAKLAQLRAALELARRALKEEISSRDALSSPRAVRDYLRLALGGREQEVFVVLLLDAQHRVIACEELFHGTLTQTSVYPREVVKCSLKHNAAAVIFAQKRGSERKPLCFLAFIHHSRPQYPHLYPLGSRGRCVRRKPKCLFQLTCRSA